MTSEAATSINVEPAHVAPESAGDIAMDTMEAAEDAEAAASPEPPVGPAAPFIPPPHRNACRFTRGFLPEPTSSYPERMHRKRAARFFLRVPISITFTQRGYATVCSQ